MGIQQEEALIPTPSTSTEARQEQSWQARYERHKKQANQLYDKKCYEEAIDSYQQAIKVLKESDNKDEAFWLQQGGLYYDIALCYRHLKVFGGGVFACHESIASFKHAESIWCDGELYIIEAFKLLIALYARLGKQYFVEEIVATCKDAIEVMDEKREQLATNDTYNIAIYGFYQELAGCYRYRYRYEDAIAAFLKVIAALKSTKREKIYWDVIANSYNNIAECQVEADNCEKAIGFYSAALATLKQVELKGETYYQCLFDTLFGKSEVYIMLHDQEELINLYSHIARDINELNAYADVKFEELMQQQLIQLVKSLSNTFSSYANSKTSAKSILFELAQYILKPEYWSDEMPKASSDPQENQQKVWSMIKHLPDNKSFLKKRSIALLAADLLPLLLTKYARWELSEDEQVSIKEAIRGITEKLQTARASSVKFAKQAESLAEIMAVKRLLEQSLAENRLLRERVAALPAASTAVRETLLGKRGSSEGEATQPGPEEHKLVKLKR